MTYTKQSENPTDSVEAEETHFSHVRVHCGTFLMSQFSIHCHPITNKLAMKLPTTNNFPPYIEDVEKLCKNVSI